MLSNIPSTLAGHSVLSRLLTFLVSFGKTVNGLAQVMTPFHCSVTTLMSQLPDLAHFLLVSGHTS